MIEPSNIKYHSLGRKVGQVFWSLGNRPLLEQAESKILKDFLKLFKYFKDFFIVKKIQIYFLIPKKKTFWLLWFLSRK